MQTVACHKCGHIWQYESVLGRADECPSCHWDAHVCLNCQFYDRNAHHQCREPDAEFVKEKEEGNFCDFFSPIGKPGQANSALSKAKSDLDALFGKKSDSDDQGSTKSGGLEEELQRFLKKK